ncbi:hypothetical protein [Dysosmobacter sp.]|uniref:hypothetical protein n=1 Tax=Dysosmobacter sp. TaxID=2591382 RepID=UPI003D8C36F3
MSKLAQTSVSRVAASVSGEGGEELAVAVFQPVLQWATYDSSASFDPSQALYDAAIGAVDVAGRRKSSAQTPTASVQSVEAQAAGARGCLHRGSTRTGRRRAVEQAK